MDSENKKIVCIINDLIEINNDRMEGYENAAKETKEPDLKSLFNEMSATSKKLKEELIPIVLNHNGKIEKGSSPSGKLYRTWMNIKSKLAGKKRRPILSSCEYGEDVAQKAYATVLKENDIPLDIKSLIEKQKKVLKLEHNKIKKMRDLAEV